MRRPRKIYPIVYHIRSVLEKCPIWIGYNGYTLAGAKRLHKRLGEMVKYVEWKRNKGGSK